MGLEIITNNAPRDLIYWHDLTDAERREMDWTGPENGDSFFRYRGALYALGEFTAPPGDSFPGWNGIHHETYFSGVLVRWIPGDAEAVICGRFYS